MIFGEIVIDEIAEALVDDRFFHQRRANPHRHAAKALAPRRLGVEDAPRRAHAQQAANAHFGGRDIDADLAKMRAEARLRELLVEITEFDRSEEHTSELQSLMRISYAVFCLKKKKKTK